MNFEERLNRILNNVLSESEFDYLNDWEKFRQERERLRQQAQDDQRKAADDEASRKFQDLVNRAGGFAKWVSGNNPDWQPPSQFELVEDIETGSGILLPSLKKKGKDLYLFIPWALVEFRNPTKRFEGEILRIFPFCQFDEAGWPSKSDFEWESARPYSGTGSQELHDKDPDYYFTHDTTWNKRRRLNEKAAMRLFESDKNHYHMLRGADKDIVDTIVESSVEDWFHDHQEIESQEDYED